jgi:YaiO family outer membrane protein
MKNPELAEPVFRSITLEDPASVEATLGLGNALVALDRYDEAIVVLQRAEKLEPKNPEVLSALGNAHRLAGNTRRAVLLGELSAQLVPTTQNRQTLEQARIAHDHRIELHSFGEQYNTGVQDTGSVDVRANFRVDERLRVIGRGQWQRKFEISDQRGGGGLEWAWRPGTAVLAHVLIGPDNVVLPRVDVNGAVEHQYRDAVWSAGYRFFDFANAHTSVLSPAVTWSVTPRVSLGGEYLLAITTFDALAGLEDSHSGTVRAGYLAAPRLWLTGSATRGIENLETLSPDRLGNFDATTVSGGVQIDLPSLTSVRAVFERQWRTGDITMSRLSLSLVQRF